MKKLLFISIPVIAFSLSAVDTGNFLIIYPDWLEKQAWELATSAETIRSNVLELLDDDPGSVTIYLGFAGSYTNGFADPLSNSIVILAYPKPSPFMNFESWYPVVLSHELTHIVHLNMREGIPMFFDILTGIPVLDAQFRSPFVESTTVFSESSLKMGGRLNNPLLDSLVYYAKLGGWFPSLARVSSPPLEDLLGYALYYYIPPRFYSYLVRRYGREKTLKFLRELSSKPLGAGIEGVARDTFGKGLEELYEEWKDHIRSFDVPAVVFERENTVVVGLDEDEGKIWIALRRYGLERVYGSEDVEIGRVNNGVFEKTLNVKWYAGNLRVENGKIYYMIFLPKSGCCRFPGYETAIVMWDGAERTLVTGFITSFDVEDGKIYYAEYDPSSGSSVVHTPRGNFVVDGMVREIAAGRELALLISVNGMSSVLRIGGMELEDARFKYSLRWCGESLCFVAFDEDGANLYRYSGSLEKLTERLAMIDFTLRGKEVIFSGFSPNVPAVGIYKAQTLRKFEKPLKPHVFKFHGSYRKVNGTFAYLMETLKTRVHVPFIVPFEGKWLVGFLLGGVSPDHSLVWGLSPVYWGSPDLWTFLDLDLGSVKITVMKTPLWEGATLRSEILTTRISNSALMEIEYWISSGESAGLGVKGWIETGAWDVEWKLGFEKEGAVVSAKIGSGDESGRFSIGLNDDGKIEVSSRTPISSVDAGIIDPYFHVSHLFWGIDVSPGRYFRLVFGGEIAEFLSYRRSFPWIGLKVGNAGFSVEFGMGM